MESCIERVINESCDHQWAQFLPALRHIASPRQISGKEEVLVLLPSSLLWEPPSARFDRGPEAGEPSIEPIQIDLPG